MKLALLILILSCHRLIDLPHLGTDLTKQFSTELFFPLHTHSECQQIDA